MQFIPGPSDLSIYIGKYGLVTVLSGDSFISSKHPIALLLEARMACLIPHFLSTVPWYHP